MTLRIIEDGTDRVWTGNCFSCVGQMAEEYAGIADLPAEIKDNVGRVAHLVAEEPFGSWAIYLDDCGEELAHVAGLDE